MLKKVGIVFLLRPRAQISNQGIGRLLAFFVESCEIKPIIAVPSWYKEDIKNLLKDHSLNPDDFELLSPKRQPAAVRLVSIIIGRKEKRKRKQIQLLILKRFYKFLFRLNYDSFYQLFSTKSILILLLLMPFALLTCVVGVLWVLGRSLVYLLFKSLRSRPFRSSVDIIKQALFGNLSFLIVLKNVKKKLKNTEIGQKIYRGIWNSEVNRMISIMNLRGKDVCWLIAGNLTADISKLRAKKFALVPDLITYFFSDIDNFLHEFKRLDKIIQTMRDVDGVICHSQHVKKDHLHKVGRISLSKIEVIPHGSVSLQHYLQNGAINQSNRAKQIIREHQLKHFVNDSYLKDFDFSDTQFIFYSSQVRLHKNILNLLKAYNVLLRKKHKQVKLILTASFENYSKGRNYLISNGLQKDVLFFHNVSSEVLAALNHLALCSVNPTLFEGGFPFTFCEAYSVGTPSVMSNIPIVTEHVQDSILQKKMLFNPHRVDSMVERIMWAIDNRDEIFRLQKPLYEALEKRKWIDVAKEYVDYMSSK